MSQSPQAGSDRRARVAVVAAAVAVSIVVAIASPARANLVTQVTCVGTWDLSYSPGLTLTPQTVTVAQQKELTACAAPLTDPGLGSGAFQDVAATLPNRSCIDLTARGDFTERIYWRSHHGYYRGWSDVTYHTESRYADGQLIVVQAGTVSAGRFSGATMLGQATVLADLTQCLTTGVTHLHGPYTLLLTA